MKKELHSRLENLPDWRDAAAQERKRMPRAEPPCPDRWKDTDYEGSLGAAWLEQMMGFPEGWTDVDCESPRGWAGFPAPISDKVLFATPIASDCKGSRCKLRRSAREDIWQIKHGEISPAQYSWELPRLERGDTKKRKKRIHALGNAVVPQQVYPLFKAITEIEEALG